MAHRPGRLGPQRHLKKPHAPVGGFEIQTRGKKFGDPSPRSRALWEDVLKELRYLGLIEERGSGGEVFSVARKGYRVADAIKGQASE